ncbi:AraC family transcriptional regulator [Limosilactobacillus sp. STM2_1]|uniref:AraC family transcriptional regulator n=1 Tax=Limosilactobacillus rudii TaxID=2759755 RepID=A0A7W3UKY2_9LACO|nr:helix-turn-helix domain-containing protein [Limosilactobacillus rudii]MBB1079388.1 AraC family transcriptional regulator [Limosilactobacillus rudii]MBB1097434.1 AraC family transcriptional regulator [Limosilactobacillus rudii]MCD7134543.1 AraC family transcriptional regulator [Limosilactobacillus rudii]
MYEYSSKFLNDIQKVTKIFQDITKNNIVFTSMTGAVVDCNTLLFDSNVSLDYLKKLGFKSYSLFPLSINSSLSGFFILDTSHIETDFIKLCGKYIEISLKQTIDDSSNQIIILNPIESSKISSLAKSLNGILSIAGNSNMLGIIPPQSFTINGGNSGDFSPSDIEKNIIMALKYINANLEKSLTLENVSQKIYLSPSYLSRIFKNYFNDNFINYINLQKIALAQEKLVFTNTPINKLAHSVGFSQTSYFTKIFKQKVGMTPSKYRKYNSAIKKIYTIPRSLDWRSNKSVYEISKEFFDKNEISFKARDLNGYPYIYSINDLSDIRNKAGWVYTVDCSQPIIPASEINVLDRSVIQWIYTEKII